MHGASADRIQVNLTDSFINIPRAEYLTMSHDLHSLIDQALERTQRSTPEPPAESAVQDRRARLSNWQSDLAVFSEQFQRDAAGLLSDLARLTAGAAPTIPVTPEADLVDHRTSEHRPTGNPATDDIPMSNQQHDRLSALRERLSQQLQTQPTGTPAESGGPS